MTVAGVNVTFDWWGAEGDLLHRFRTLHTGTGAKIRTDALATCGWSPAGESILVSPDQAESPDQICPRCRVETPPPTDLEPYDYAYAKEVWQRDPPVYALIAAAAIKADSTNFAKIRAMWPGLVASLQARYDAPGGALEGEKPIGPEGVATVAAHYLRGPR